MLLIHKLVEFLRSNAIQTAVVNMRGCSTFLLDVRTAGLANWITAILSMIYAS